MQNKSLTNNKENLLGDIDIKDFQKYGHEFIDWIAEYLSNIEDYPVLSQVKPGEIKSKLPQSPPLQAEKLDQIFGDFKEIIMPGITHWNHPSFHAYFSITGSVPGILGELLTAGLNVQGMLWKTSPSCTELELLVIDWLRQMLGLKEDFFGIMYDYASVSTMHAIAAARENLNFNIKEDGMAGRKDLPKLRLYCSTETHSSIEKAAIILGLGQNSVRKIDTDDEFKMRSDLLSKAINEDKKNGYLPFCVIPTIGTTSSTSIDPVSDIVKIAKEHNIWVHVDAAYGGVAGIIPEMRYILNGCDEADSIVLNPHKWLFTPIDCSVLLCRKPEILKRAFSLVPEYLKTGQGEDVVNLMDYGIQLGRRFRALKLWMVIRSFGQEGLAARLREHIRLANLFAKWVDEHSDFQRMAPVPLSTVCFRVLPSDLILDPSSEAYLERLNQSLMDSLNEAGKIYISHTKLKGKYVLRFSVGNLRTTEDHIKDAFELICKHGKNIDKVLRKMSS